MIVIQTRAAEDVSFALKGQLDLECETLAGQVRITSSRADELISDVYRVCGDLADSVSIGRPTLEDVFVEHSGQRFEIGDDDV